jgi:L-asparaginase II
LARYLALEGEAARIVGDIAHLRMRNWNGIEVGQVRVVGL